MTEESDVRHQLAAEGRLTRAGEVYGYIVTNHKAKHGPKTMPLEMIEGNGAAAQRYDSKRYVELLTRVANTVTLPFGYLVVTQDQTLT